MSAPVSGESPQATPARSRIRWSGLRGFIAGVLSVGVVVLGVFLWREIQDRRWREIPDDLVWDCLTNSAVPVLRQYSGALTDWLGRPRNAQSEAGQFYQALLDLHSDSQIRRDSGRSSLVELGYRRNSRAQVLVAEASREAAKKESSAAATNLLRVGETLLFHAAKENYAPAQWLVGRRYAAIDTPASFPGDETEAIRWLFAAGTNGLVPARLQTIELLLASTNNLVELAQGATREVMEWAGEFEQEGNVSATFWIGMQMLAEARSQREVGKALKQIEKAARKGDARALHVAAGIHLHGTAGEPDIPTALTNFLIAAEKGHRPSQVALGKFYHKGDGAKGGPQPDYTKALHWFKTAAEAGDPEAEFGYAELLLNRAGVTSTVVTSLERSARKGYPQAQLYLAAILEKDAKSTDDYARVIDLYRAAAAAGLARAHYALGNIKRAGLIGVEGLEEAVSHFRIAANEGYAPAQYALGQAYESGKVLPQSAVESVRWFERAAGNFSMEACEALAVAYQVGNGVITNDAKAAEYRAKASAIKGLHSASNPLRPRPQ